MFDNILAGLQTLRKTRRGWTARCPAHQDRHASLSLAIADNGRRLLVYCFAGCRPEEIARALGVELRDVFAAGSTVQREDRPARPGRPTLMAARYTALSDERYKDAKRAPYRDFNAESDAFRTAQQVIAHARAAMTELGDCDEAWEVLATAAVLDTESHAALAREEEELIRRT